MFSGIVEEAGQVIGIVKDQENVHFTLTNNPSFPLSLKRGVCG